MSSYRFVFFYFFLKFEKKVRKKRARQKRLHLFLVREGDIWIYQDEPCLQIRGAVCGMLCYLTWAL